MERGPGNVDAINYKPMANADSQTLVLALTGASGIALGRMALQTLAADARVGHIYLVVSDHGKRVMWEELGERPESREALPDFLLQGGGGREKIECFDPRDIGAAIASGSVAHAGVLILPCSMGTLAAIAHGLSDNLIERAADVCLKERRRLVLAIRETPLHLIHLRNMVAATEAGATVFPIMPAFYDHAVTPEDAMRQFVARVLAHFQLEPSTMYRWPSHDQQTRR